MINFSDLSFLKFLAFSTVYGRFKGRGVDLPLPPTKIRLSLILSRINPIVVGLF